MSRRLLPKQLLSFFICFMLIFSILGVPFAPINRAHASTSTIYEWLPAPGQFINTAAWGGTGDINAKWTNQVGSPGVSLGSFGGSIVFKFAEPIPNNPKNPYGVDFTIFGNAFSGNEEPAGVAVAQDDGTGKPGPWYYIAGSEHYEDSTIWDYQVTYTNPLPLSATHNMVHIPWTDNKGGSGAVKTSSFYSQAFYPASANYPNAPAGFNDSSFTYSGVKINVRKNAFGYPDTHANGSVPYDVPANPYLSSPVKGDPIDISWAVDKDGKPVYLSSVSYVKVYNAVQMDGGAFGEIGAEITALHKVTPNDAVGETADLSSIVLSGVTESVYKHVTVTAGVYAYNDILINADKIKITANGTAPNIFVNNTAGTTGTLVEKEITLSETTPKLVRVIAQDGIHAPKIVVLSIKKGIETNKTALQASIANAEQMNEGDYTIESWQTLQSSLATAKAIAADSAAAQTQIDNALSSLQAAIQALQTVPSNPQQITVSLVISGYSATAGKAVNLPQTQSTVEKGKSAAFAIEKLLNQQNIPFINAGGNYITSIGGLAVGDGGSKSGWMYLVNGQFAPVGIADYTLNSGDIITFVYVDDYMQDITALADKTALKAQIAEVEAMQQGNYTDASWQALQNSLTLAKAVAADVGAVPYHAETALSSLTAAVRGLQVKTVPPVVTPQTITVSFTVNGYSAAANKNVTVPQTSVTVETGKTASFVIEKVLNEKTISFVSVNGAYISSVGGLAEFDGGPRSGWLYSVNGKDPDVGIASYVLSNGDSIVLRYTDDYLKGSPSSPTSPTGGYSGGYTGSPTSTTSQIDAELSKLALAADNNKPIDQVGITTAIINVSERMSTAQAEQLVKDFAAQWVSLEKETSTVFDTELKDGLEELRFLIPKDALNEIATIRIDELLGSGYPELVSGLYQISPKGTTFSKPSYMFIKVPVLTDSPENLTLVWLDEATNQWIPLPAVLDLKTGVMTAKVSHFTKFAVIDRSKLQTAAKPQKPTAKAEIEAAVKNVLAGETLTDWEAIALARAGQTVPATYMEQIERLLEEQNGEFRKVTDLERIAIAVKAAGGDPTAVAGYNIIEKIYNHDKMTNQGVNGPIFALLALNSGRYAIPSDAAWNEQKLIQWILAQQNETGGFPHIKGEEDNVDITAMAVTALSAHMERSEVQRAVESAIDRLARMQLASGGFSLGGEENSESVAQVIIALSSAGIGTTDQRFIKSGTSLIAKLLSYRNEDGGFAHTAGQASNEMATEQALLALVAYERHIQGQMKLFQFYERTAQPSVEKYVDESAIADWAVQSVYRAYESKLVTSISETEHRFAPKQEMTRAQFAAIVVRLMNETPAVGTTQSFADVHPDSWYYGYVMKAKQKGIIEGISDTSFAPDQSVSREQMAAIVARALKLEGGAGVQRFVDDDDINRDLAPYVYAVQQQGLMEGYDGGFHPSATVTREMAAVVAVRMLEKIKR